MLGWDALYEACKNCRNCDLADTRHNVVFGEGARDSEVMFIGEGPGEQEDLTGRPFVGRAGPLPGDMLSAICAIRWPCCGPRSSSAWAACPP